MTKICKIKGCGKPRYVRGWCQMHYTRWWKHGNLGKAGSMCEQHGENSRVNGRRVVTPEYRAWQQMRSRCYDSNRHDYGRYGGRGIKVCTEWCVSFTAFLRDMGRKPTHEHTLDRIDNNGDYNKENCRWATYKEQGRNTSRCKLNIEYAKAIRKLYAAGHYTQSQLARMFGVRPSTINAVCAGRTWA